MLANVNAPLEESAFLRHLHKRYRIVIGPVEAKTEVLNYLFDETDFKKNRDRLAEHLIGMGLAHRMSGRLHICHQPDGFTRMSIKAPDALVGESLSNTSC